MKKLKKHLMLLTVLPAMKKKKVKMTKKNMTKQMKKPMMMTRMKKKKMEMTKKRERSWGRRWAMPCNFFLLLRIVTIF